jgi:hypothetical protein
MYLFYSSLICVPEGAAATAACSAPERVCQQEPVPVLDLDVSVSLQVLLCCTGTCLSTKACATPVRVFCRAACYVPGGV